MYSSLEVFTFTVVSRKLICVVLSSCVNLMDWWIPLSYVMNSTNVSSPCVHIMNMSSMNLSHITGFSGQFASALDSNLSMNRLAKFGATALPMAVPPIWR